MQFFRFLVKIGKILIFINQTISGCKCHQDASFEPLTALIGSTGRPVAMSMGPKIRENKKLSYCWETVRRERIAEMDVEMTA